jgi:2-oxoacid:acceptor oxidoreductase delta subunit (pyruvate/2-ketoisovalerate family)
VILVEKAIGRTKQIYGTVSTVELGASTGPLWREKKPVWDRQRCFKCGMCWLACPDAAIRPVDQGFYDSEPERCKGCGICAAVCWNDAITMAPEKV